VNDVCVDEIVGKVNERFVLLHHFLPKAADLREKRVDYHLSEEDLSPSCVAKRFVFVVDLFWKDHVPNRW